jgi:TRAP-type C4-dicarboxylate transport system permease small subunit
MRGFMEGFRRLLAGLGLLERLVGVALLVNIVVNIGAQVVSRYLFGYPLVWVEELATYSFIWGTFVGASLGLKYGRHVRIETFVGNLPRGPRALLRGTVYLLMLALMAALLPQAWTVMGVEGRSQSISLPVQVARSWFYSIPLFVGAAGMALTCVYLALAELWHASGGPPPRSILEEPGPEPGADMLAQVSEPGA